MFLENFSLKDYNTFGLDVRARHFAAFFELEDLEEVLDSIGPDAERLVLGGGSNILFTRDVDGYVLKNGMSGLAKIREDEDHIYVRIGAGEIWDGVVDCCVQNGWAGIENLSLIPGSTGAAPMQNIGAYGVELKNVFHELEAYHVGDRAMEVFSADDCNFGYRESVFKRELKDQFIIMSVTLKLNKKPSFNTSYGMIEKELERMQVEDLSISAIREAVSTIRRSKLPDPAQIGNAGSFFKNPVISAEEHERIKSQYPKLVSYPAGEGKMKLAAGWLIDKAGWKGHRSGDYGVHQNQALVLVNHGGAKGEDIFDLSEIILQDIKSKFGVNLEREVNIY